VAAVTRVPESFPPLSSATLAGIEGPARWEVGRLGGGDGDQAA